MESFRAFRIRKDEDGYRGGVETTSLDELSAGEVVIRCAYSSVNYKDALAGTGKGKILRQFPLIGGIDVSGTVISSEDSRFNEGNEVLVTGCGMSETRDGGYSEYLKLDSRWVIPMPEGLDLRSSMILGTAGFTAGLCHYRMLQNGQTPEMGPIVVNGATGGVGTLAIDILTRAGFEVHAITGKVDQFEFLQSLGATQCISRKDLYWGQRPLERATWAGAIDNVGGEMLEGLTRVIKPWGNIASLGMAGGMELHTTVMPFIIRGISLLGINSAGCPYDIRQSIWNSLGGDLKPTNLEKIAQQEVTLEQLPEVFDRMLSGGAFGRTLVRLGD